MTSLLLNDWLQKWRGLDMDLAGSAGPPWTLGALLGLEGAEQLGRIELGYSALKGSTELCLAIAQMYDVDPDWVIATNGATEAFNLIFAAHAERGHHVLLPAPCYPALPAIAQIHGLCARSYSLLRDNSFEIDISQVLSLAVKGRTAMAVINTPHNPTGAVIGRSNSVRLAELLEQDDIPLVADEVFHPAYHGESIPSLAGCRNVILVGDLSKAFSLPGLRIGWIVDPDDKRRSRYRGIRGLMSLGGSPVLEHLALHAFSRRQQIIERTMATVASNLSELKGFMARNNDKLSWVQPKGGLVAFPWFRDGRDTRPLCERLAAKGVLFVPGNCFGMPEGVRIGMGCEPAIFEAALNILEEELTRT